MEENQPQDRVLFYSIGDWGSSGPDVVKVANAMNKYSLKNGKPNFILALGDNFYPSGIEGD
jgi:hypothetical protein